MTHRHSRAFLHALLHSDNTAALHHLTVHNIAYQVTWARPSHGAGRALAPGVESDEAVMGGSPAPFYLKVWVLGTVGLLWGCNECEVGALWARFIWRVWCWWGL